MQFGKIGCFRMGLWHLRGIVRAAMNKSKFNELLMFCPKVTVMMRKREWMTRVQRVPPNCENVRRRRRRQIIYICTFFCWHNLTGDKHTFLARVWKHTRAAISMFDVCECGRCSVFLLLFIAPILPIQCLFVPLCRFVFLFLLFSAWAIFYNIFGTA